MQLWNGNDRRRPWSSSIKIIVDKKTMAMMKIEDDEAEEEKSDTIERVSRCR